MASLLANQAMNLAVLADVVTAVTGELTGAEVELFQNDILPTPETPLGDYTLATYDGYAAQAVTWLAPSVADDGSVELVGTVPEWRPTGSVTPNVIYGMLLLTAGGALRAALRFDDAPIPMGSTLDSLITTIRFRAPCGGTVAVVS